MQKVPSARRTYLEAQVAERIACVRIVARVAPHQRAAVVPDLRDGAAHPGLIIAVPHLDGIPLPEPQSHLLRGARVARRLDVTGRRGHFSLGIQPWELFLVWSEVMMIDRQHNFIVQKAVSGRVWKMKSHRDGRLAHRAQGLTHGAKFLMTSSANFCVKI